MKELTGLEQQVSRSTSFAEGWLSDENGKHYAHATATCAIFDIG